MNSRLNVVFDTNVYLSAVIFGGNPKQCLELARDREITLFISKNILIELTRKLYDKFELEEHEVTNILQTISEYTKIIAPTEKIDEIKADPSDNIILECALEAKADYIVSGDKKHLLSLKNFKGIPIISAKEFLDIFYTSE